MISGLIDKGFAYEEKGSVYFRVDSFPDYGKLANLQAEFKAGSIKEGAGGFGPNERRGTTDKENNRDFALWKAATETDGDVVWNSKFGKGRPGNYHVVVLHSIITKIAQYYII
jgi:cysteinyl-tRNA synthetase